jgi:hypothetical protein
MMMVMVVVIMMILVMVTMMINSFTNLNQGYCGMVSLIK